MSHYASLFRGIAHLAATAQDKGNMISALGQGESLPLPPVMGIPIRAQEGTDGTIISWDSKVRELLGAGGG